MKRFALHAAVLLTASVFAAPASAEQEKFTLRYTFQPGETLRWDVVHRSTIRTTVSGTTQTTELVTQSTKIWKVLDVASDGTARFENSVEDVRLRQKLTGRKEIRYDSRTDKEPPAGYESFAANIGVPISAITIDPLGKTVAREQKIAQANQQEDGKVTIPLPEHSVAVGESWSFPYDIIVPTENGMIATVKTRQKFTLQSVKTGVATIQVATQVLTPVRDPAVEAQLVQRISDGHVRFDVDAGRILSQQMDVDKVVVGFRGEASSLNCQTRFTEELLPERSQTASRPAENRVTE